MLISIFGYIKKCHEENNITIIDEMKLDSITIVNEIHMKDV